MSSEDVRRLASRVERLERQNRRLVAAAFGILLVAGAGLLMAAVAPPATTVIARRFELVDGQGRERAVLQCERRVEFDFSKNPSKPRVRLGENCEPELALFRPDQTLIPAVSITTKNGEPDLTLADTAGTTRAQLSLADPTQFVGGLSGEDRDQILSHLAPAGTPVLQLVGDDSDIEFDGETVPWPRLMIGADKEGNGGMVLFDARHNERLAVGRTTLYLGARGKLSSLPSNARSPQPKVTLPESSIAAFNGEGDLIARWPLP